MVKPYEPDSVSIFLSHWQNCNCLHITVILSKKQWYNAVTPRDPRTTPLTMSHIVDVCPSTKFPGGLRALYTIDDDTAE